MADEAPVDSKNLLANPIVRHLISVITTLILAALADQGIRPTPISKDDVKQIVTAEVDTKVDAKVDQHLNEVLFGKIPVGAKPECKCEKCDK